MFTNKISLRTTRAVIFSSLILTLALLAMLGLGGRRAEAMPGYTCSTVCHGDKQAPTVPVVTSSTHPNSTIYYSDNNPSFSWSSTDNLGLKGYTYVFNQSPSTIPGTTNIKSDTSVSYAGVADGIWYLHVRAVDNGDNWSGTAHYMIKIDTVPVPDPIPTPDPVPDPAPTPDPVPVPDPVPDPAPIPVPDTVPDSTVESVRIYMSAGVKFVKIGDTVTLKGVLKDQDGNALAGKEIRIKARGKIVGTIITGLNGKFTFEYSMKKTTAFKAIYLGENGYKKHSKTVVVHAKKAKKAHGEDKRRIDNDNDDDDD